MIDWWIELQAHSSPHHHEHPDASERKHVVRVRVSAPDRFAAVERLERAIQALVGEPT